MFTVDKKFPSFSLEVYLPDKDQEGRVSSAELFKKGKGKWVLLFYYPADFTYVCPTELYDLHRKQEEFKKAGVQIIAVSTDTVYTHKGWVETEKLLKGVAYPLAADHNGRLSRELGIYNEENGLAQRAAFVIDPDGILRAADVVSGDIGRSASELLRKIRALQFVRKNVGKVCPASWDIGAAVLTPSIKIAGKVHGELGKK
jgi:peroxiredoxin (alkyl hydroperoxide reductase subunit C)